MAKRTKGSKVQKSEGIRKSLEQHLRELHAKGLIDITPKNEATTRKWKSLAADKRITNTGR